MFSISRTPERGEMLGYASDGIGRLDLQDSGSLLPCPVKLSELSICGGKPLPNTPLPRRPTGRVDEGNDCPIVLPKQVASESEEAGSERLIEWIEPEEPIGHLNRPPGLAGIGQGIC